jgi:hypothetical protein
MTLIITVYEARHAAEPEQVEMTQAELQADVSRWEQELRDKTSGRTAMGFTPKPEKPVDLHPRNRQALCQALHIVDCALGELPTNPESIWTHLHKLGHQGHGGIYNRYALTHYLQDRINYLPAPLPAPDLTVGLESLALGLDHMYITLDYPENVCRYQSVYGPRSGN